MTNKTTHIAAELINGPFLCEPSNDSLLQTHTNNIAEIGNNRAFEVCATMINEIGFNPVLAANEPITTMTIAVSLKRLSLKLVRQPNKPLTA